MKKRLIFTVYLFIFETLFLIAGTLPFGRSNIDPAVIFSSPVFIILNLILLILLVYCAFASFRKSRRYINFLLVHLGAVALIIGAFISFFCQKKFSLLIPTDGINPAETKKQLIINPDEPQLTLLDQVGFNVYCVKFHIDYFPVDTYQLYQKNQSKNNSSQAILLKAAKIKDGFFDFGQYGRIKATELKSSNGFQGWKLFHPLTKDLFLLVAKPTDKHYSCKLKFVAADKKETSAEAKVNHPAVFNNWRLYLTDYDHKKHGYVILTARSDPGRNWVIPGIWMLLAGIFGLCYFRRNTQTRNYQGFQGEISNGL